MAAPTPRTTTALVLTGPRTLEPRELPVPQTGDDDGLLRVEASGICGSDYQQYVGRLGGAGAVWGVVPGHEIVGRVERVGTAAAARWGVRTGDLVVLEEVVPAEDGMLVYGLNGRVDRPPGLWGGYAPYVYLHPRARLHRVPDGVSAPEAALWVPLANGVRWAGTAPGTRPGDTVVVLGPGQQGLGCVVGARHAGAGTVVVTGRAADAARLDVARALGADHVVDVDAQDAVAVVRDLTGGRGADVVVDATAGATRPVVDAIAMARRGGTVVLGGLKDGAGVELTTDDIVLRQLVIRGVGGHDSASVATALEILASRRFPVGRMRTHDVPLADADRAVRMVGREIPGEEPIHVTLVP